MPPKQIANAKVGPALQYPTLCKPVAIVVRPNPISPTTAGFAHHSLQMPLSANSAILSFSLSQPEGTRVSQLRWSDAMGWPDVTLASLSRAGHIVCETSNKYL